MNRFSSIFSQLLQLFPRIEFQHMVKETRAERGAKGFTCWAQFVCHAVLPIGTRSFSPGDYRRSSKLRREIETSGNYRSQPFHPGLRQRASSWELYQKVFLQLFDRCRVQVVGKKTFRFKNKLISMDSSTIDLCLEMFDWARFRRTKGAIKLHLLLDHDGYLPCFAIITEGKVSDVKVAHQFRFERDTIVVDDRGYNDYALFGRWTDEGVYFVTRMKDNAVYEVVGESEVPQNRNILKDEMIELRGPKANEKCPRSSSTDRGL